MRYSFKVGDIVILRYPGWISPGKVKIIYIDKDETKYPYQVEYLTDKTVTWAEYDEIKLTEESIIDKLLEKYS